MSDRSPSAPFFTPAANETHVQKLLREALEYVHAHGAQVCVEGATPGYCQVVTVCGFPMQAAEPDRLTLIAARQIMQELARGLYESDGIEDEYECLGWGYDEVMQTMGTYVAECNLTDAYVWAVIENAYERVALAPRLGEDRDPIIRVN